VTELSHSSNNSNSSCVNEFTKFFWISWEVMVFDGHKIVVSILEDFFIWSSWLVKSIKVHELESKACFRGEEVTERLEIFLTYPLLEFVPTLNFPTF